MINTLVTLEEFEEMSRLYIDSVEINKLILEDLQEQITTTINEIDEINKMIELVERVEELPSFVRKLLKLY